MLGVTFHFLALLLLLIPFPPLRAKAQRQNPLSVLHHRAEMTADSISSTSRNLTSARQSFAGLGIPQFPSSLLAGCRRGQATYSRSLSAKVSSQRVFLDERNSCTA